jgi:drug/metabolite transporter (DMT)-like permease
MFISGIVYTLCLLLFAAFNQKQLMHDYKIIKNSDVAIIALTSIITGFFANYLYFYVLKDHESSLISALIYSCPIFTLLLAYLLLNERIDRYGILGIIFVVLGVGFVSLNNTIYPFFPEDR